MGLPRRLARLLGLVCALALTLSLAACAQKPEQAPQPQQGQPSALPDEPGPVRIEIDAGHNENPFKWEAEALKQKGLEFEIIGLPFVGQYEKIVSELIANSGAFDLMVFPPMFLGDFVAKGFLRPLDDFAQKYDPQLADVIPAYRDPTLKKQGKLYALPYDGDTHMLYYRKDLFEDPKEREAFKAKYGYDLAPPKTWKEFMDIAEFFTRPPELYGTAFYGQRGFSYAWWVDIWAGMGGKWFDDQMNATINDQAGVDALKLLIDMKRFSPPDVLSYGYPELRDAFMQGKVAMIIQWADVGKKANDPQQSKIVGKVGFGVIPGRSYMPYSRVMAVAAGSKRPERAYRIAHHMTIPENSARHVSNPGAGEDPYRYSHMKPELYETIPPDQRQAYVDALKANIEQGFPELNIPGAPRYLDLLDMYINQALAGQIDPKTALDLAAREWNNLTANLGKEQQLQFYKDWIEQFRAAGVKY